MVMQTLTRNQQIVFDIINKSSEPLKAYTILSNVQKKGDIFRVNESTLNTSVTIAAGDNASCAGPLTVSTSGTVNLTVNGNLTII